MQKKNIIRFSEQNLATPITQCIELAASGSARKNYILQSNSEKYIVTVNENSRENESFFYFSTIFQELSLNTPAIIAISEDRKTYIQTYLGDKTLSEIIGEEGTSLRVKGLVTQVLDKLYHLQSQTKEKIDYSKTFEYSAYDRLPIIHDLNYFKFMFVDVLEIPYHKTSLLLEFESIAQKIETLEPKGLMIRDFQSRNIMVNADDQVGFIDYQSAMHGPLMYDVVSFLFQAKANFSNEFKLEMLEYYIQKFNPEDQAQLRLSLPYIQLIRYMQVLGAYGFRGLVQRKKHFLESIPKGIKNLCDFAKEWPEIQKYSELLQIIQKLDPIALDKINTTNY